jgi:hypothetical protein
MHTFEQCQTKINGIKILVDRINKLSNDPTTTALCESASEMCEQLLREKNVKSQTFLQE